MLGNYSECFTYTNPFKFHNDPIRIRKQRYKDIDLAMTADGKWENWGFF